MNRAFNYLSALSLTLAACSPVYFVDPDRTLKEGLKIVEAVHLRPVSDQRIYLHLRVATREGAELIRFRWSNSSGTFDIPQEAIIDQQTCGQKERCFSVVMPPNGSHSPQMITLLAPTIGHQHEASVQTISLPAHRVSGEAEGENGQMRIYLEDPIRAWFSEPEEVSVGPEEEAPTELRLLFPRKFEVKLSKGPCGDSSAPQTTPWTEIESFPAVQPAEYDGSPFMRACVQLRPQAPESGPIVAEASVPARAVVRNYRHVYSPPVEVAPLAFLVLYDLELTNSARCKDVQDQLADMIETAAQRISAEDRRGAPVVKLPPVQIAQDQGVSCRQTNRRDFDGAQLAERAMLELQQRFPGQQTKILVVYVTNLDLALPIQLSRSLLRFQSTLDDAGEAQAHVIAIGPEETVLDLSPDQQIPWLATIDPSFPTILAGTLGAVWPFQTAVHTPGTVVPLSQAGQQQAFQAYRLCKSSEGGLRLLGIDAPGGYSFEPPEYGPAYQVNLPTPRLETSGTFIAPQVEVGWQGCLRLCDHPAPGGPAEISWLSHPEC